MGLPPRPFLYTLDQLSSLLSVSIADLRNHYVHFEGRTIGLDSPHTITARNIAPPDKSPDWRISEKELIRWMRRKGYKYYESGWIK